MADYDATAALTERMRAAIADVTPLAITGGGTKDFLGRLIQAEAFPVREHRGVLSYEPTELVFRGRGGTPLSEVEAVLADRGQMLPFEPPHFGPEATLGGTVAAGLSGPRRPYAGAVRDFVLGAQVLTGKSEVLAFGGQVMKNVAGYDVSRLMAGAMGTLGVLLDVSLKVLPAPEETVTLDLECDAGAALDQMNAWAALPLPISATAHHRGTLSVRLSGTRGGVSAAADRIGGERRDDAHGYWTDLREQRLDFFREASTLWRLSVPAGAPLVDLPLSGPEDVFIDWGGAQRWVATRAEAEAVRAAAKAAGGHATCFRGGDRTGEVYQPLADGVRILHERLKAAFDPHGLLNRGRMYQGL